MAKFKVKTLKVKIAKSAKSFGGKSGKPSTGKGNAWAAYIGSSGYKPSNEAIPD